MEIDQILNNDDFIYLFADIKYFFGKRLLFVQKLFSSFCKMKKVEDHI